MPARHKTSFISTAEWNQFGERLRSRLNGGPNSCYLTGAILRALLDRWRRSSRKEARHLIDLIEQLTICEDRLMLNGEDLLKELDKADQGVFGPILRALACAEPDHKIPKHDALVIRIQYDLLWKFVRDYPFVARSMKKQRAWLTTHWKDLDQLLRQSPCHCLYRIPDAEPPVIPARPTRKSLFLCLLAHIHRDSTTDSINQLLKPSARKG